MQNITCSLRNILHLLIKKQGLTIDGVGIQIHTKRHYLLHRGCHMCSNRGGYGNSWSGKSIRVVNKICISGTNIISITCISYHIHQFQYLAFTNTENPNSVVSWNKGNILRYNLSKCTVWDKICLTHLSIYFQNIKIQSTFNYSKEDWHPALKNFILLKNY